jgi:hypothetical protein
VSDDQKSVARPIEYARGYAVRKGWTVLDEQVYADDGLAAPRLPTGRGSCV